MSATLCTIATTTKYVHTRRTCPRTFRHTELRGQKEIDRVVLISRIQQTAPSASRSFLSNFTLLLHLTPISRFLLHVFHRIRLVFWMEFGELYPYNTPFDSFSSYPTVFSFSISFFLLPVLSSSVCLRRFIQVNKKRDRENLDRGMTRKKCASYRCG